MYLKVTIFTMLTNTNMFDFSDDEEKHSKINNKAQQAQQDGKKPIKCDLNVT